MWITYNYFILFSLICVNFAEKRKYFFEELCGKTILLGSDKRFKSETINNKHLALLNKDVDKHEKHRDHNKKNINHNSIDEHDNLLVEQANDTQNQKPEMTKEDIADIYGMRIKLSRYLRYQNNVQCQLAIETKAPYHVLITFRKLKIEFEPDCGDDFLELLEVNGTTSKHLTDLPFRLCGKSHPNGGYATSGSRLLMYFQSDSWERDHGFDVTVTSFHEGPCHEDEFMCSNGRCIHESLKCDGNDNCGDRSDEPCQLPFEAIIAIIFGVIIGLKLILIAIHYVKERKKFKKLPSMNDISKFRRKSQAVIEKGKIKAKKMPKRRSTSIATMMLEDQLSKISEGYKHVIHQEESPRVEKEPENTLTQSRQNVGIQEKYHRFFHY